mmetsp:Transcript_100802/g.204442  ORF Transcript_100802/g.204442 Transcript_100802/m.204442 type:complete len:171 (+) Transcript_100802:862-1374(+)
MRRARLPSSMHASPGWQGERQMLQNCREHLKQWHVSGFAAIMLADILAIALPGGPLEVDDTNSCDGSKTGMSMPRSSHRGQNTTRSWNDVPKICLATPAQNRFGWSTNCSKHSTSALAWQHGIGQHGATLAASWTWTTARAHLKQKAWPQVRDKEAPSAFPTSEWQLSQI